MKSKEIVTGVVGIAIGFIAGFFISQFVEQGVRTVPAQESAALQDPSQLPEGHPPAEVVETMRQLQVQAESSPQEREARVALGNAYYDMGRFDAAIKWYEEALQLESQDIDVRTDLATSYLYIGNPIKAVELYRRSLQIDSTHAQTLQNIGVAYFSTGNFSEAVENWEKLIELHPDYPRRQELQEQIEKAKAHLRGEDS